ncbi:MAG TPA: hypothetical protein EYQ26_15695 [Rhodospirillales bacterium]|jgi:hypothetical protein|nr:hypothetical protein [Rhodospirillales bacterium]
MLNQYGTPLYPAFTVMDYAFNYNYKKGLYQTIHFYPKDKNDLTDIEIREVNPKKSVWLIRNRTEFSTASGKMRYRWTIDNKHFVYLNCLNRGGKYSVKAANDKSFLQCSTVIRHLMWHQNLTIMPLRVCLFSDDFAYG